jgi:hypothetical protein
LGVVAHSTTFKSLHFKAVKQVIAKCRFEFAMGKEFSMAGTIGRRVNELASFPHCAVPSVQGLIFHLE